MIRHSALLARAAPALLAVTLCGCGGSAAPTTSATASPSLLLTQRDSGRTVAMAVGDHIAISLPGGQRVWNTPSVSSASVRVTRVLPDAGDSTTNIWDVAAQSPGSAQITITGTVQCSAGVACPQLAFAYTVTITVH